MERVKWLVLLGFAVTIVCLSWSGAGDTVYVKGGISYNEVVNETTDCTARARIVYRPWAGTGTPVIEGAGNTTAKTLVSARAAPAAAGVLSGLLKTLCGSG